MQIDSAIEAVMLVDQPPIGEGPQDNCRDEYSSGLDTRQDSRHGLDSTQPEHETAKRPGDQGARKDRLSVLHQCDLLRYRYAMPYAVQTEVFEGPFDVLLRLILDQEVDIYEVSLTAIVDAYLTEMDKILGASQETNPSASGVDLELATEFLLIAATLVELKTRRLLPDQNDGDLDEELALWEERDLLLARLLECQTFKSAASALRQMSNEASASYPRTTGPDQHFCSCARPTRWHRAEPPNDGFSERAHSNSGGKSRFRPRQFSHGVSDRRNV